MTRLVNSDGQRVNYLVVKPDTQTVLAALHGVSETTRRVKELMTIYGDSLAVHSVTNPECPQWVQNFLRSDATFCSSMAQEINNEAEKLRLQAAELLAKADERERDAAMWSHLDANLSVFGNVLHA